MTQTLEIVPLERSHLEGGLQLSRAAGWPHRAEDWETIFAVSKGITVVEGQAVAGVGFCTVFDRLARLNTIIVDEALRGRGIGRRIVERLVALADGRPMALVATEDGFPLYRKLGFEPAGQIDQHQGLVVSVPAPTRGVRAGGPDDIGAILAMDRAATDADRSELLTHILTNGRLFVSDAGFAILHDFGRGKVLGPVVARDPNAAHTLIATAVQDLEGTFLRMDTDPELGLTPMIEAIGLSRVGSGTTMYAGRTPQSHGFTTFALASQALG